MGGNLPPPWRRHCPGGIAGLPKVSIPNQGTGETSPGLPSLITCREINVQKTDHHSLPTSPMKHDGHSVSTLAVTDLLTRLRLHWHITMITMQLGQTQAGLSNRSLQPVEIIGCQSIYLLFRECCRFQPYDCHHSPREVDSVHLQILLTGTCRQCGSWSVTGHSHRKVIGRDPSVLMNRERRESLREEECL